MVDLDKADIEESGQRITHRISEILVIIYISVLDFTFLCELPGMTFLPLSRKKLVRDCVWPTHLAESHIVDEFSWFFPSPFAS